jgi:hypothetical protein
VPFDWLWELDRKLNEAAMDAAFSIVAAAAISESLRFLIASLMG